MDGWDEFDREYFLQTRREIDTEKQERDHLLNFAVAVLGAIAFGLAQNDHALDLLKSNEFLLTEVSALVVLTSLFWVRRKKLQQIGDRWLVLYRMLEAHNTLEGRLEAVVVRDMQTLRYLKKDIVLNFALSLPIYLLMVWHAAVSAGLLERLAVSSVIALHISASWFWLAHRLHDPFARPNPPSPSSNPTA